jgi:hypothetical protein
MTEAQQGNQCRPRRSQAKGAACRPGRRTVCRLDFGKLIADDTEKWGKVIRAANIKLD